MASNDPHPTSLGLSLPDPFRSGDFAQWLVHFELCAAVNGWSDVLKARKLPALLKDDALLIFFELPEETRLSFESLTSELKSRLNPVGARNLAFREFERAYLTPRSLRSTELATAAGNKLLNTESILLPIQIGRATINHQFLVADQLIVDVIIGTDFLAAHQVAIDVANNRAFGPTIGELTTNAAVSTAQPSYASSTQSSLATSGSCAVEDQSDPTQYCSVPWYRADVATVDLPRHQSFYASLSCWQT
uniref:Retrotransposon gag domain-containing protein n=1 Tax=Trichuris muris TaxID=70415 RepID=A0A5S6PZR6_TRIMR